VSASTAGRTAVPQSLVQLTLLAEEALGHLHFQADIEITAAIPTELRQALTTEAQHGPRLSSGRHRHTHALCTRDDHGPTAAQNAGRRVRGAEIDADAAHAGRS
jgi:hypothetical protein